ncbi:hypothetical protein M747DRAFT_146368 [Aspergillus niger ATCC 13496]|uniref:Uncharacterized protein n=1 Tax=Aspergillus niger ATCC 13496 TaxID=1353008 RepID=A0A370BHJ6_ASPNG|nr:hypothetical protein M747DRAFT_146368 [Aspergillus niger ATCC 13496]
MCLPSGSRWHPLAVSSATSSLLGRHLSPVLHCTIPPVFSLSLFPPFLLFLTILTISKNNL